VVSKQAVRSFLAELGETGAVTLVLTTHDLADIDRLVVDLDAPLPPGFTLAGTSMTAVEADGHRVTFALDDISAGAAVAGLVAVASVRDLSVVEPDIEDVVARLYGDPRGAP
jgi:ABC-2 type transport system ATP-binding protein